jgi:ketosteroid isomerase-like protein
MSLKDVELVRGMAEAFNAGGVDAVREYFHPEIEWHEDPAFPESGVYRGIDVVVRYTDQFLSEFREIHYEAAQVREAGDHVLADMRINGSGKTSGATFELSAWWVLTVRDGKVIRGCAYLDRTAALEAVGLSE